jgi:hypothetical protein
LSQFASLLLATNTSFRPIPSLRVYATMDDSHLLITAGSDPSHEFEKSM